MGETLPERRMAQNEVFFRGINQRVQEGFDELKKIAKEDGASPIEVDPDMAILFLCECADEDCYKRISLTLPEYQLLHKTPKHFVVFPGHNIPRIEDIVQEEINYIVIKKHESPPHHADKPTDTDIDKV